MRKTKALRGEIYVFCLVWFGLMAFIALLTLIYWTPEVSFLNDSTDLVSDGGSK